MYSIHGKLVYQKAAIAKTNTQLEVEHLQPGIYIIQAVFENTLASRKIVIE